MGVPIYTMSSVLSKKKSNAWEWGFPLTHPHTPEALRASFRSSGASYTTLDPPFSKSWIRPSAHYVMTAISIWIMWVVPPLCSFTNKRVTAATKTTLSMATNKILCTATNKTLARLRTSRLVWPRRRDDARPQTRHVAHPRTRLTHDKLLVGVCPP